MFYSSPCVAYIETQEIFPICAPLPIGGKPQLQLGLLSWPQDPDDDLVLT